MTGKKNPTFQAEEIADFRKLQYILENWDDLPLREETRKGDEMNGWLPTAIIADYIRMSKNGMVKVKYDFSRSGIGRLFSFRGRSLQGMPREVRHTVAGDYYHDIDIKNAHPVFLLQYCEKHEIACKHLRDYVDNREERIAEVLQAIPTFTREDVKRGVLALTNGGRGVFTKAIMERCPEWVHNYKWMVESIHNQIMEREPIFSKIGKRNAEERKKQGGFYNPTGSTVNLLLCDIENTVLMAMVSSLKEQGIDIKNIVLVFDGLMITKKSVEGKNLHDIMVSMERDAKTKTGYEIVLVEKPMTERLPIPDEFEVLNKEIIIKDDENEASIEFYNMVKEDIRRCDGVYFIRNGGVWVDDEKEVERVLIDKCLRANFIRLTEQGEKKNYSSKLSGATAIVKAMLTRIPTTPHFIKDMKKSTYGRILFSNGFYDFTTGRFTSGFDSVDSMIQINRPMPTRNADIIKEVYDRVLYPIWGGNAEAGLSELGTAYLRFVARAIAGHIEDKKFGVVLGERDCGKGVLCSILMSAFERYVDTMNPENLLVQRVGYGDEAKKLSWTMRMEHTRIAITNEIKIDEAGGVKMDGNMLKKICSGGDVLEARQNYKNERSFQIGATPIFSANDFPVITPADAYEKMMPFPCPHKFQESLTDDMARKYTFLRNADSDIKRFCERPEVGDAFFFIVADHYRRNPADMTTKMVEYRSQFNSGDEFHILLKHFQITGNADDCVPSSAIVSFLKEKKLNLTMVKVNLYLENRGVSQGRPYINGKRVRAYTGMVMINENDDNNSDDE